MNLHFFVCFHNTVHNQIYKVTEEEQEKYITFYGVKQRQSLKNVIYESTLPHFNPLLQLNRYNEGSCIYHVFKNNLYTKYDYVGFCQYDMEFPPHFFKEIQTNLDENANTIFNIGFFEWWFKGGQTTIIKDYPEYDIVAGLTSYNQTFGTTYTPFDLVKNKMIKCNTFLIPKRMYAKMMYWLEPYFKDSIDRNLLDTVNNCPFDPGHMIEALTGMFLSLEISQGAVYKNMILNHDHVYKIL